MLHTWPNHLSLDTATDFSIQVVPYKWQYVWSAYWLLLALVISKNSTQYQWRIAPKVVMSNAWSIAWSLLQYCYSSESEPGPFYREARAVSCVSNSVLSAINGNSAGQNLCWRLKTQFDNDIQTLCIWCMVCLGWFRLRLEHVFIDTILILYL